MAEKKKVKLGLKNLVMLPSYFNYNFVHPRQKAPLRHELSPKFFVNFGPEPGTNPSPTRKAWPDLQFWSASKPATVLKTAGENRQIEKSLFSFMIVYLAERLIIWFYSDLESNASF